MAKKKTSKKNAAGAATGAAVGALFSGQAAPKPKTAAKGKVREDVSLPPDLQGDAEVAAAYRVIKTDLEKKGKLSDKRCQAWMLRWWCERFAATGNRPDTTHFIGGLGSFDFVLTKKITITQEKQEALELIGADISNFVETSGISVDMDAVAKLGYMDRLQEAIGNLVAGKKTCPKCDTSCVESCKFCPNCGKSVANVVGEEGNPEHVEQIFAPKVTTKEGIIEALKDIAEDCEADGGLADKIQAVVEILKPVPQVKKAEVEGKSATECFAICYESKVAGKGSQKK